MRKKLKTLAVSLLALTAMTLALFSVLAEPAPDHPFFRNRNKVLVMAHRGGAGLWPENTLYAFEHATKLGVDVLETDTHLSADGTPVLIHDHVLDRTTDGTGPIENHTLAELKALDAGYRWTNDDGRTFPHRGQGLQIPTLEELFIAFPNARINIELKSDNPALIDAVCKFIRQHNRADRTLIVSSKDKTIRAFRRACPEAATATAFNETLFFYGLTRIFLGSIYSPSAHALQVPEHASILHVVTPAFIKAAHKRNLEVHVWTIDETEDMQRLLDLGVDGIFTDYPDRLLTLLGRSQP